MLLPLEAEIGTTFDLDPFAREPEVLQPFHDLGAERAELGDRTSHRVVVETEDPRRRDVLPVLRRKDAPRGEGGRLARHDDRVDVELGGGGGGEQTAATAVGVEGERSGVDPALHRHRVDRVGHRGLDDPQHTFCSLIEAHREGCRDPVGDRPFRRLHVEVHPRAEETPGIQASEDQMAVGDGRLLAAEAEAGGARSRAGALRPDAEGTHLVDPRDRAAARTDRGHIHGRGEDGQPGDLGLGALLDATTLDDRHVVGRASHVGADRVGMPEPTSERGDSDHAAGRPGREGPHRQLERPIRAHHAAVRLHHADRSPHAGGRESLAEGSQVRLEQRLDVRVDHRGGRPLVLVPFGRDRRRQGHREIRMPTRDRLRRLPFVLRVRVGVQEAHGDRLGAFGDESVDLAGEAREVERRDLLSPWPEPLGDLAAKAARNERLGRHPDPVIDEGAVASRQLEDVAEPSGRDEPDRRALPLQEGVDRHRRSVEEAFDLGNRPVG